MSKAAQLAALIGSGQAQGDRNLVINGAMQVAQRGSVTGVTSGYGGADRFQFSRGGACTIDMSQSTDVPSGQGFPNSMKLDVNTADSSLAAGDFALFTQKIEAQNTQHLKKGTASASSVVASFWIKSPITGTYILELYDFDNSRHINKSYTINTANTFEYKTITFAGDTSGALNNDNGTGLQLGWWLAAGSTFSGGTLQTDWGADTAANRAVGQVNAVGDAANNIFITGVQLEIGDVATPFEHEDFGTTLRKCQRYFAKSWSQGSAVTTNAGVIGAACVGNANRAFGNVFWPVTMRAAPTVIWYSGSTGTANKWRNASQGTDITAASAISGIGQSGYGFVLSSGIVGITDTLQGHYQAVAEL